MCNLRIFSAGKRSNNVAEFSNRAWVLGDGRFKQQIEKQTGRRASPNARGGDRKSEKYRAIKKSH